MSRPQLHRVRQSKNQLQQELREQLDALIAYCELYDSGRTSVARGIATSLRLLFNQGQSSKTRSLLDQLEMRSGRWTDSAFYIDRHEGASEWPLALLKMGEEPTGWVPKLDMLMEHYKESHFSDWWAGYAIKSAKGHKKTRWELVTIVANQAGGAHVDEEWDANYVELVSTDGMGWTKGFGADKGPVGFNPAFASIRQIAWEVIDTFKKRYPEFLATTAET